MKRPEPDPTEWTFLLYVGSVANSLDFTSAQLLTYLKGVRGLGRTSFIYQIATEARVERGRVLIERDGQVNAHVLGYGPPIDSASPHAITAFVDWATAIFPSRHVALVIKSHGGGLDLPRTPTPTDLSERRRPFSIIFDGVSRGSLSNPDLRAAVARTVRGHVDVYAFDACDMNVVEILYEIRDVASFAVASGGVTNVEDFSYARALNALRRQPGLSPRDLAKTLAEESMGRYVATELSCIPTLASSLDALGQQLGSLLQGRRAEILCARPALDVAVVDLQRTLSSLLAAFGSGTMGSVLLHVEDDLKKACFASGKQYVGDGGTGIFFPPESGSPSWALYGSLAFATRNRWTTFVTEWCFPQKDDSTKKSAPKE